MLNQSDSQNYSKNLKVKVDERVSEISPFLRIPKRKHAEKIEKKNEPELNMSSYSKRPALVAFVRLLSLVDGSDVTF